MEKKKISVLVAGQRFNLITDEAEKYVMNLASTIDARITSASISGGMTRESAAVLTALDLADDAEKQKREIDAIREQVKDYLNRIEELTAENAALKSESSKAKLNAEALSDARASVAAGEKERDALRKQIYALKEQIALMQEMQSTPAAPEAPAAEEAAPLPAAEPAAAEEPAIPEAAEPVPVTEKAAPAAEDAAPTAEEAAPAPAQPSAVTAEDDLFFDIPEEPVRPVSRKEKKNRHEHNHVNPFKQQHMNKQGEQKGYTQQRQYSLFDTDE